MSRILLADDSPHAQRMGERILRDEGHEVITVSDGLVAMLRLKDAQPDLIIADISMPEVSGYELVRIREEQRRRARVSDGGRGRTGGRSRSRSRVRPTAF